MERRKINDLIISFIRDLFLTEGTSIVCKKMGLSTTLLVFAKLRQKLLRLQEHTPVKLSAIAVMVCLQSSAHYTKGGDIRCG